MIKTKHGDYLDVEELSWEKARDILVKHNPDLVHIIDEISPGNEYKLYRARYPYGAKIVDKTESFLPLTNGRTISFNDLALPKSIFNNLSYNPATSNPVGIVLDKRAEFYLSLGDRVLPYMVMEPGHVFGLTRILDVLDMEHNDTVHLSFFMWELVSGVRSCFMLPKVTDAVNHNHLAKKYGLLADKPQNLKDCWSVFKDIAERQNCDWRSEFMYFSNNWFEKLEDPAWMKLYNYFLKSNRLAYEFWRNYLSWQITFSQVEQNKNMKYPAYTLDTAKHLFGIAAGSLPGFRPATDESAMPINLIQEAYLKGYGLTDYWPTIIEPTHFNLANRQPVYYSVNYPTLFQSDPNTIKSIIAFLDELMRVVEKYKDGISNDKLATSTSLYKTAQQIKFSFYHDKPESYSNIHNVMLLPQQDSRFCPPKKRGSFPKFAHFLTGCIKIAPYE